MQWMNPAGAWALAALAAILLLYILKERLEPTEVSSTYLWRRAMIAAQAERPFQKLRRNLLMLLQLLTALALALALMRPMTLGGQASEVVFVFDLSASMQAVEDGVSRLDVAREDARRRVEGMPDGSRVSVLTAGTNVGQPLSRAEDRTAVLRALDALRAENGSADLDGALSLAMALRRELEGTQIIVYTDQALPAGDFL
ncbi:MAG: VWA domain-containing protein, partial [Christensenellales bacterium]|nr:VWA domain-containing protein [Christensenellales bacterium]